MPIGTVLQSLENPLDPRSRADSGVVTPITFAHRGARADLPENTLAAFARALERGARGLETDAHLSADGEPVLVRVVDPDLIGGIVFRVGDTVYDGSVASRLEQLRQQMIHRSVNEIQRRRDRFSSTARN